MENTISIKLLNLAVGWAEKQSSEILKNGRSLTAGEIGMAKNAGVSCPEQVRISEVMVIPAPNDTELQIAASTLGFHTQTMVGLTLGYGIYVVKGHEGVIAHELRHVQQYERLGSIHNFLALYLEQLSKHGYRDAPLEIDARKYSSA